MKKKLIAMVLGMAVCVGQMEAIDFKGGNSPIPNPIPGPITDTIYNSLLDNQFGELLSSAVNFLDVCFGMKFGRLDYVVLPPF